MDVIYADKKGTDLLPFVQRTWHYKGIMYKEKIYEKGNKYFADHMSVIFNEWMWFPFHRRYYS